LIYLPVPAIAAFGLLLIFGHNAFDHVNTAGFTPVEKTEWTLLHVQGFVHLGLINFFVLYPLIPWIGVMAAGYSFGTLFTIDAVKRKKILTVLGLSAIALFIVIRYFAIYGDATTWTYQGNIHRTILSFINVTKYPPSLDYLLVTLGPGMLFLAWVEGKSNRLTDIFVVYGRVPLFYYILHLYLIHLLNIIIGLIVPLPQGFFGPQPIGLPLAGVYVIWLSVVFILYFPCRWFMKYKREHKQWWLSYL